MIITVLFETRFSADHSWVTPPSMGGQQVFPLGRNAKPWKKQHFARQRGMLWAEGSVGRGSERTNSLVGVTKWGKPRRAARRLGTEHPVKTEKHRAPCYAEPCRSCPGAGTVPVREAGPWWKGRHRLRARLHGTLTSKGPGADETSMWGPGRGPAWF